MKAALLQFFASREGGVLSGTIKRRLVSSVVGGITWALNRYLGIALSDGDALLLSGFVAAITDAAISDWVARNLGAGVAALQDVTNDANGVNLIPVDGVPGALTIAAHKQTVKLANSEGA